MGKLTAERLLNEIKKNSDRETVDALINMSEDFKEMKLKEYKLVREHNDMKEKADYYTRLLKQRNDQIASLEETAAKSEARMIREREDFRKRDIERKELFLKLKRLEDTTDIYRKRDAGKQSIGTFGKATMPHLPQDQLQRELDRKAIEMRGSGEFQADWTKNAMADSRIAELQEQVKRLQAEVASKQS